MANNVFFSHDGNDFEFKKAGTLTGHIRCVGNGNCISDANVTWCKHLEGLFKMRKDLQFIWFDGWDDVVIYIPIFPTQDIWELVFITKIDRISSDLRIVRYDLESVPLDKAKVLTTLSKGEGRKEIRASLWDIANSLKRECASSAHNVHAELAWQNSLRGSLHHLNVWSVFKTGMCLACNHVISDLDDTIPERTNSF